MSWGCQDAVGLDCIPSATTEFSYGAKPPLKSPIPHPLPISQLPTGIGFGVKITPKPPAPYITRAPSLPRIVCRAQPYRTRAKGFMEKLRGPPSKSCWIQNLRSSLGTSENPTKDAGIPKDLQDLPSFPRTSPNHPRTLWGPPGPQNPPPNLTISLRTTGSPSKAGRVSQAHREPRMLWGWPASHPPPQSSVMGQSPP